MKTSLSRAAKIAIPLTVLAALGAIISPTLFFNGAANENSNAPAQSQNWMETLDGRQKISRFSIPGTHNSAALFEPIRGTARCQNLSISQQLDAGVRFLDIRCRHVNDAFRINHGPIDQRQSFADVLAQITKFLDSHTSETVILSVKEEYQPENNARSFEATFASYVARNPARWRLDPTVPTLDQARGKIVLLRRFAATKPQGIDASNWPDNQAFATENLRVQDVYKVASNDEKWSAIESLLRQTGAAANPPLTLNFASGVRALPFDIPSITRVAGDINNRLDQFFARKTRANYSCVIVDFADSARCAAIYRTNSALLPIAAMGNATSSIKP